MAEPKELTPDEVRSLDERSNRWQTIGYSAAACVFVGIVLEDRPQLIALMNAFWLGWSVWWRAAVDAAGPIMVSGGIAVEILASMRESYCNDRVKGWYQLQVEKEKRKRAMIEERLRFRSIPEETMHAIVPDITAFRGQRVEVALGADTFENVHFASQIAHFLQEAGWTVITHPPFAKPQLGPYLGYKVMGTGFLSTRDAASRAAMNCLFHAFSRHRIDGISAPSLDIPMQDDPRIVVVVGDKPTLADAG